MLEKRQLIDPRDIQHNYNRKEYLMKRYAKRGRKTYFRAILIFIKMNLPFFFIYYV